MSDPLPIAARTQTAGEVRVGPEAVTGPRWPDGISALLAASGLSRPELVLSLLITFVLAECDGTAIPNAPDVNVRGSPALASALCSFRAQHDDPVALGEYLVDLKSERAAGQRHEVFEEPPHLGVPAVVA